VNVTGSPELAVTLTVNVESNVFPDGPGVRGCSAATARGGDGADVAAAAPHAHGGHLNLKFADLVVPSMNVKVSVRQLFAHLPSVFQTYVYCCAVGL
jgi:hypothetical protein